jgi:hypothetical protein
MGIRGIHIEYCWEIQKERNHYEDREVGGWIILKWILERYDVDMDWIDLTLCRDQWRAAVNTVMLVSS